VNIPNAIERGGFTILSELTLPRGVVIATRFDMTALIRKLRDEMLISTSYVRATILSDNRKGINNRVETRFSKNRSLGASDPLTTVISGYET
jgi:hypothetical protein